MTRKPIQAALAAHRFGLGEASLAVVGDDAIGWLQAQIGPAEPQRGSELVSGVEGLRRYAQFLQRQRTRPEAGAGTPAMNAAAEAEAEPIRKLVQADVRARLVTATLSTRPFNERLALFWANHFTVSLAKGSTRGVVGAFEREAIRPHIGGRFVDLLKAAVHHAGMLRYLDNDRSAGPDSPAVTRRERRAGNNKAAGIAPGAAQAANRISGLNENLAREVLELHTLGVAGGGADYGGWGGYTQADVTAFARVLTGWRVPMAEYAAAGPGTPGFGRFDPAWHQPGPKTVVGKTYREGPQALDAVLQDLALHPSTARFVSTKLARHFVADEPPPALVARMAAAWARSEGDLATVYRTLTEAPEAWQAQAAKLKSPEEFVISTARLLQLGEQAFARQADAAISQLGQRVQAAPSPAGWPDRAEEWLGPDAVWKRVEWATRVADRVGRRADARALAQASLGPLLNDSTVQGIARAADGPQALALLLLAPEFQRR